MLHEKNDYLYQGALVVEAELIENVSEKNISRVCITIYITYICYTSYTESLMSYFQGVTLC